MSAVASHCHKINRRHVHFRALNWDDEVQRTNRGVAIRRERQQRKHKQKMAEQQRERDRWDAFLVLRRPANATRILQLCLDDDVLGSAVDGFLRGAVGRNPGNTRQEQLERFQNHLGLGDDELYDRMTTEQRSDTSLKCLFHIFVDPDFKNEFLREGTVVSESSISMGTIGSHSTPDPQPTGPDIFDSPIDDGETQGGGFEEPPVPEQVAVPGNHVGNQVVNQPAPVNAPDDAAYAAAAVAAPDDAVDNDSRSGIKRSLPPERNQDDDAKKQRTCN